MTTTQQSSSNEEDEEVVVVLPLLTAGIGNPEFPTLVVSMAEERKGISLRQMYEQPFEAILQSQSLSLMDLFSNDEESYEDFWEDVPLARRRCPPSGTPWAFSLGDCIWIRTLAFDGDVQQEGEEEL
mmetsp:Transcript_28877/g.54615  ORF Transcript_28877/g.54615 Transcript_28877/m.54615 type:complete len:127 (+) Transcript_28877:224-604(+)